MKLSIKFKILFLFTITLLITTGLNFLFMSRILKDNYVEVLDSELVTQANTLKSQLTRITDLGIAVNDVEGFDRMCLDLVKKHNSLLDAMVIDIEGTILFHSVPAYQGRKIDSVEIIHALRGNQEKTVRVMNENHTLYRVLIPVPKHEEYSRYGIVVSCNPNTIDAKVLTLINRCNIFFLSTFALASLLLLIGLTHLLTKPMGIILRTIHHISESRILQQRIELDTQDEIGQIAAAFNKMTKDLQESTTSIESLNREIQFRKTAEIEAHTARLEAEAANKMKSIFLANMSHEIRTPMNALIGFSEILCEENLNENHKKYVNIIADNARSLLRLLNDILDFSRIEAGKLQLEEAECSPSQILEDIFATLAPLAANKGIEFKLFLSPGLPLAIHTDPLRLRQCVINLVSNAVKFTNQGHVFVRAMVSNTDQQQKFYIVVEDTGTGIAKEKTAVLFDALSQVDSNLARCHGGTGLGLAITKQLVELMGGQISVISDKGTGSVFTIILPMKIHSVMPQEKSAPISA